MHLDYLLKIRNKIRNWRQIQGFPEDIKNHINRDKKGIMGFDPGHDRAIEEGIGWLCRAQDFSKTADGGVARHYSMFDGWSSSYPETTGYIISTLIDYSQKCSNRNIEERVERMLDWLVRIQCPEGGFRGGTITNPSNNPVTFNTGQILLGLCSSVSIFRQKYMEAIRKAADWLVKTQDEDGCWRRYPTPFASPGEKAYETHVAWALFEAERIEKGRGYAEKAMKNIRWALKKITANGWINDCCLNDRRQPLTHTIGYFLRGLIEAYHFNNDEQVLDAAIKIANALILAMKNNGHIAGRLNEKWKGTVKWACLTGTVQIAYCWIELYKICGERKYWEAGIIANSYVRRTLLLDSPDGGIRGGIKGCFPVDGGYGAYLFLNWACKFFVDSNMLEKEQREKMVGMKLCGNAELISD